MLFWCFPWYFGNSLGTCIIEAEAVAGVGWALYSGALVLFGCFAWYFCNLLGTCYSSEAKHVSAGYFHLVHLVR